MSHKILVTSVIVKLQMNEDFQSLREIQFDGTFNMIGEL